MNTLAKLLLGIVIGGTVMCLCAAVSGFVLMRSTGLAMVRTLNTSEAKEVEVAGAIADYTLPDGFGQAFATNVAGFSMVSYTGDDEHSHIYFFQLPSYLRLDQAEIERQLREKSGREGQDWVEVKEVDRKPATICGQEVTLVVSEGVNHDQQPYRQVSAVFQGRGGDALVMFEAPIANWDQAVVDEFIASIQ